MRRLPALLLALVLVLLGSCSSDPTASGEYQALDAELAELTAERDADAMAEASEAEAIAAVEANETAHNEAFLDKDLDALADTWTEDYIFVDQTFGDYVVGKAANRELNANVLKWADPDRTRVVHRFVSEDGTFAVSTWEWIGTNFRGDPFDLPFAMIAEYEEGKIAKQTIYYASPDARSQLLGGTSCP